MFTLSRYAVNSATKCGFVLHVVNLWSARIVLGPGSVEQERIARERNPQMALSKPPLGFWRKGRVDWRRLLLFPRDVSRSERNFSSRWDDQDLDEYMAKCLPDSLTKGLQDVMNHTQ